MQTDVVHGVEPIAIVGIGCRFPGEAASSIASPIKAAVASEHRDIPRRLHVEAPNPQIPVGDARQANTGRIVDGISRCGTVEICRS